MALPFGVSGSGGAAEGIFESVSDTGPCIPAPHELAAPHTMNPSGVRLPVAARCPGQPGRCSPSSERRLGTCIRFRMVLSHRPYADADVFG